MVVYLSIFADNTSRIELRGLRVNTAVDTFEWINDATVTATITDSAGAEVVGETWPLTLNYESGSDGNYSAVLDDELSIADRDNLTAVLTATSGSSVGKWTCPVQVATRTNIDE